MASYLLCRHDRRRQMRACNLLLIRSRKSLILTCRRCRRNWYRGKRTVPEMDNIIHAYVNAFGMRVQKRTEARIPAWIYLSTSCSVPTHAHTHRNGHEDFVFEVGSGVTTTTRFVVYKVVNCLTASNVHRVSVSNWEERMTRTFLYSEKSKIIWWFRMFSQPQ